MAKSGKKIIFSEDVAKEVSRYAAVGIPLESIGKLVGLSDQSIYNHYKDAYQTGVQKANAAVAGALYNKAIKGDTTAMIFWLKTRARWKEVSHHEITGENGKKIEWVVTVKK